MNKVLRLIMTFAMAFVFLLTTLITAGCPSEPGIHKAAKASASLASLTRDAIAATRKAYENNLISLDAKDKAAVQLDRLIAGGQTFNAAVNKANEMYKKGNADVTTLNQLNDLLTKDVTTPFLAFLSLIGAVSPQQAPYLTSAISALRTAILLVGSFVGKNTVDLVNDSKATTASFYENHIALGGKIEWPMLA